MDIDIKAGRDVRGQWVAVAVKADHGQLITGVSTALDGETLGDDFLARSEVSYSRTWHQVGGGAANDTHEVVVTATDAKGQQETASKEWSD